VGEVVAAVVVAHRVPERVVGRTLRAGTNVMIVKVFSPKNLAEKWRFCSKYKYFFAKLGS
jgi:hypothetical protein